MLTFIVAPPLQVPLEKGQINREKLAEFWRKSRGLGKEAGCYVLAVPRKRGAAGMVPIYVGKSVGPFRHECFNPEKLLKLGDYIRHHPTEYLTLFLIVHPPNPGGVNRTVIQELETYLIRLAYKAHSNLINQQHAHQDAWTVRGVLHDGKGKRSRNAKRLRSILGIDGGDEFSNPPAVPELTTIGKSELGETIRPAGSVVAQQQSQVPPSV
jgi:hypothetical protein